MRRLKSAADDVWRPNGGAFQLRSGRHARHADEPDDSVVAGMLRAEALRADGRSRGKAGNPRVPPALAEDR